MLTIAILARNEAATLPMYLHCIESQVFPKKLTNLYIRTNDNYDNTEEILKEFIERNKEKYNNIYFDNSYIDEKLKILSKIRQDSINYAIENNTWYFIADCNNFISPTTIDNLIKLNLPIVSPLLLSDTLFSNYYIDIDSNGHHKSSPLYFQLLKKEIKGIVEVPFIRCTYLIHPDILKYVSYDDNSHRYEYVIFSDVLRKHQIPQYLSNVDEYGYIVFWKKDEDKIVSSNLMTFFENYYPKWGYLI